jgi:branched-chain amino acid transport system ATP-binding protein
MVYNYFPALKQLRKNIAGYLPAREQQMLVIDPRHDGSSSLMMLDEPSLGWPADGTGNLWYN